VAQALPMVVRWYWAAAAAVGAHKVLTVPEILAQIHQESGGNPRAVSGAGAQGLMQIMPATGRSLGLADPWDPLENVLAGAAYMASLMEKFHGSWELALAGYNAGPGAVERAGGQMPDIPETKAYVETIVALAPTYAGYLAGAQLLPVLRPGDHGDPVRLLQRFVGVGEDGDYGPVTEAGVLAAKKAARLPADAIVGPALWSYFMYRQEVRA
jgi:hypothetical protein